MKGGRPWSRVNGPEPLLLPATVVAERLQLAQRISFIGRAFLLQGTTETLEEITSTFCGVRVESSESHLLQACTNPYYAGGYEISYNPVVYL